MSEHPLQRCCEYGDCIIVSYFGSFRFQATKSYGSYGDYRSLKGLTFLADGTLSIHMEMCIEHPWGKAMDQLQDFVLHGTIPGPKTWDFMRCDMISILRGRERAKQQAIPRKVGSNVVNRDGWWHELDLYVHLAASNKHRTCWSGECEGCHGPEPRICVAVPALGTAWKNRQVVKSFLCISTWRGKKWMLIKD